MKKILKINAVLIILFTSLLIFMNFKNNDSSYWMNWGQSQNSQNIYLRNTGFSGADLYTMLTSLADENEVNLIKSDYLISDNKETIVKSVYLGNMQDDLFGDNRLIKGNFITKADNSKNVFISSKNNDSQGCSGLLFDFLDDDYIEVWTLNRFMSERGGLDGDYMIRADNNQAINNFITELSSRSGIDINNLIQQRTFVSVVESPIQTIVTVGTIISLLLFSLLCIYYAINSSKKIGVMKLNGYSNFDIWKELTLSVFSTIIIATLIYDILILFLIKNNSFNFMMMMIAVECSIILLLLLTSLLIYLIIKRNMIGSLLKNKTKIKPVIFLTYFIKSIILLILVVLAVSIGSGLNEANNEYMKMRSWNNVRDLAVLVNLDVGNDAASIKQGDTQLDKDFADYYSFLEENGAVYANVFEINPHVQFKTKFNESTGAYSYQDYFNDENIPQNFTLNTFQINQNYLNTYPLKDINGGNITVDNTSERLILIPKSKENDRKIIEEVYKAAYIDSIKSAERKNGINDDSIPTVKIVSRLYDDSKTDYFSFSTDHEESDYCIKSPIFEVLTNENMTLLEKSNIYVQGINSPLKINLNGKTSEEFNQSIQDSLKEFNLEDNNLKYMTIGEVFANQITTLKTICRQYTIALVMIYIIMTMLTVYLTKLMVEAKKKKYCIQKLYGFTFIDRYKGILVFISITNILISMIAIFIAPNLLQISTSFMSIGIIFAMLVLDVFLVSVIIKYFENKNISQMMKGE